METILKGIIARRPGITFCSSRTIESTGLAIVQCRYIDNGVPKTATSFATPCWIRRELTEEPDGYDSVEQVSSVKEFSNLNELNSEPWPTVSAVEKSIKAFNSFGLAYCNSRFPLTAKYIQSVSGVFLPQPMLVATMVDKSQRFSMFLGTISIMPPDRVAIVVRANEKLDLIIDQHREAVLHELRCSSDIRLLEAPE